jgi:hypothetical protein
MGEVRNAYKVLLGILKGEIPLGRPGRGWEDNIRMNLREIWWEDTSGSGRDQWRSLVNTVMNLRSP